MVKGFLLQNWGLILILTAFAVTLHTTIFLDKKTVRRMYVLILEVFLLSIIVYMEFLLAEIGKYRVLRTVLMAARYSATPFIISQVSYTLVKKQRWFIFIPAILHILVNFISIFTGIVFRIDDENQFSRGALGYLPYVMAGIYCIFLIYMLYKRSNKQSIEIIPIAFLSVALGSSLFFPFIFGSNYSQIFCTTIALALYIYFVFSILQMTKIDPLTGLLNRQAYYADIKRNPEDITALVSLDMNGLKAINDNEGHAAGDDAIVTVALCFIQSLKRRQSCYRVGGDEFVIVCRRNTEEEVINLTNKIRSNIDETNYSCSIGYSYSESGAESVDEMLKKSDEMMYAEKAKHYQNSGKDRRQH